MTKEEIIEDLRYLLDFDDYGSVHSESILSAIKAIETVGEFEKAHIITGGRLNGRTYAYKCGLEDGKRKALEQKPCEDAVSRQAVLHELGVLWNSSGDKDYCMETLRDFVVEAPFVTPAPKKGKWINKSQKSGCGITFIASECTCCGKKTLFNCDELIYKYCPNCGAEMESEE